MQSLASGDGWQGWQNRGSVTDRLNNITQLGGMFQGILGQVGNWFNHGGTGTTTSTTTTDPTPAAQPMGSTYANPFGASVTGGTLGAMLARQPGQ